MTICTLPELSQRLSISVRTIHRYNPPALRIGGTVRYVLEDVIEWMAENGQKTKSVA